jgi:serine palmitoyltransferase
LGVPVEDIDFISGSMENALASFGGFITGSSFVVDHQRISGVGYCFSASLPPLLAGAGIQALKLVDENPDMVLELQSKCRSMQLVLSSLKGFDLSGHELSPLKFLTLKESRGTRRDDQVFLDKVIVYVKDNHSIALIQPSCLEDQEMTLVPPTIRIAVNRLLTQTEIESVAIALDKAIQYLDHEADAK